MFIHRKQCAALQVIGKAFESVQASRAQSLGQDILRVHLNHTRTIGLRDGEDRTEIKIMRQRMKSFALANLRMVS
jgi:CobQ-like glutamine amidotransferase family enzyme